MRSQTTLTNDPQVAMDALASNEVVNITAMWNGEWNRVNSIAIADGRHLAGWSNEHGHHYDFIDTRDTFAVTIYTHEGNNAR